MHGCGREAALLRRKRQFGKGMGEGGPLMSQKFFFSFLQEVCSANSSACPERRERSESGLALWRRSEKLQ